MNILAADQVDIAMHFAGRPQDPGRYGLRADRPLALRGGGDAGREPWRTTTAAITSFSSARSSMTTEKRPLLTTEARSMISAPPSVRYGRVDGRSPLRMVRRHDLFCSTSPHGGQPAIGLTTPTTALTANDEGNNMTATRLLTWPIADQRNPAANAAVNNPELCNPADDRGRVHRVVARRPRDLVSTESGSTSRHPSGVPQPGADGGPAVRRHAQRRARRHPHLHRPTPATGG